MTAQSLFDLFRIAEIELVYRSRPDIQHRPVVTASPVAYEVFLKHWDTNKIDLQEQFKILLLNQRKACLGIAEIATGSTTACIVDTRLVFAAALKANATSILLAHNHPSGNLQPSDCDIKLTAQMVSAGKLLDIPVLDHLIITSRAYTSLADNGLMPR